MEERLGIPFARNRALASLEDGVEVTGFLDDDEWTGEDWLAQMLKVRRETGADCVWGPVVPVLPQGASPRLVKSGVYGHGRFPDQRKVPFAATNNVIFDRAFVERSGVRFDERLVHTGGSCMKFFRDSARKGMTIHLSAKGCAFETIPLSRLSWSWIVKRQYRIGNTLVRAEALDGGPLHRLAWVPVGLVVMLLGALATPFVFSPKTSIGGLAWALRGAGLIGGAFGLAIREYAPKRLSAERVTDGAAAP